MKTQIIRHGEVLLKKISELPKEAELLEESNKYIVAHSETGHHHILEAVKPFKIYTWEDDTYIEVPEIAELWHQKTGKDVHTPHKLIPGIFKVNIKKEFDYFRGMLRSVRD